MSIIQKVKSGSYIKQSEHPPVRLTGLCFGDDCEYDSRWEWEVDDNPEIDCLLEHITLSENKEFTETTQREAEEITRWRDGDVEIRGRLDVAGREAVVGKHCNYGYSGYFVAYIYKQGKRRRLKIWQLFPSKEHHYRNQGEKFDVARLICDSIAELEGVPVYKVARGWGFAPLESESQFLGDYESENGGIETQNSG